MDRLCIACGLDWSAVAAWVKAIGSIIAIAVPARQH